MPGSPISQDPWREQGSDVWMDGSLVEKTIPLTSVGDHVSGLPIPSPFLHPDRREIHGIAFAKQSAPFDLPEASTPTTLLCSRDPPPHHTHNPSAPHQLPPTAPGPNGLYFPSLATAIASTPAPPWLSPFPDPSIPTTDHTRQAWVLHLVGALANTTGVHDRPSPTFHKHWLATPPFYTAAALEHLAWTLLGLATALHTHGPAVLRIADAAQARHVARTRDWPFAHRMRAMAALLASSKARCEKCLCRAKLAMVVGNPDVLLRSTRENKRQNGKRQAWLERAREEGAKRGQAASLDPC